MKYCVALALVAVFLGTTNSLFLLRHADCQAQWTIGMSCDSVKTALMNQIHKWSGPANCRSGPTNEKCLYVLQSSSASHLSLTHETPLKHYVDDVSFTLTPHGSMCHVDGHSRSQLWYAVLDQGTNYCNMLNLLEGAHLTTTTGYTETAVDATCTQHDIANCTRY